MLKQQPKLQPRQAFQFGLVILCVIAQFCGNAA
jgi:hypothetical protein